MKIVGETDTFSNQHVIWTFMIGSIIFSLILVTVSNSTFPFVHGQTDLVSMDSSNSNNKVIFF